MANANLALISTANTFQDQMILVNNEANSVNELRNGNYFKDSGTFTIANGSLVIAGTSGTLLSVSGNSTISQQLTVGSIQDTGDATIQGNNVLLTSNTVIMQVANTINTKNLSSNLSISAQNVNAAGYLYFSGINLSANLSPNVSFFNELAILNVNNQIFFTYSGNVYINKTVWANTANIQTLNVGTLNAFNLKLDPTGTYSIVNGNAIINNLTVQGNTTIVGTTINTTDTLVIRANAGSDGDGKLTVYRGTTLNVNAVLKFNHTSNVWQTTANDAQTFVTILTTANIQDDFSSNSTTQVASANAVNAAYGAAIANATAIIANNGVFVAQRKGVSFFANSILSLNVTANGANTSLTDVRILANVTDSFLSNDITSVATANAVNAAYNSAITVAVAQAVGNAKAIVANNGVFVNQRQGIDFIQSNNIALIVTSNGSNVSLVDVSVKVTDNITLWGTVTAQNNIIDKPTIKAQRLPYVNVGTVTGNTTIDLSTGDVFDVTLAASINLTFTNTPSTGVMGTSTLLLRQTANGSNTVTYINTVRWSDNTQPVLTTTGNTMDVIQLSTYNNGSFFLGAQVYANIPRANIY